MKAKFRTHNERNPKRLKGCVEWQVLCCKRTCHEGFFPDRQLNWGGPKYPIPQGSKSFFLLLWRQLLNSFGSRFFSIFFWNFIFLLLFLPNAGCPTHLLEKAGWSPAQLLHLAVFFCQIAMQNALSEEDYRVPSWSFRRIISSFKRSLGNASTGWRQAKWTVSKVSIWNNNMVD